MSTMTTAKAALGGLMLVSGLALASDAGKTAPSTGTFWIRHVHSPRV